MRATFFTASLLAFAYLMPPCPESLISSPCEKVQKSIAYLFKCCHILSHMFNPAFIGCGGGPGGPVGGPTWGPSLGPRGPPGLGIEVGVEMGGGGPPAAWVEEAEEAAAAAAAAAAAFMLAAWRPGNMEWKGCAPWNCGLSPNILSNGGRPGGGGGGAVGEEWASKRVDGGCTTIQRPLGSNPKKSPTFFIINDVASTVCGTKMPNWRTELRRNGRRTDERRTEPRAPHGLASRIKRCACTCGFFALRLEQPATQGVACRELREACECLPFKVRQRLLESRNADEHRFGARGSGEGDRRSPVASIKKCT